MNPVIFRSATGAGDAASLFLVHEQCRAADGTDPDSLMEYQPAADWFRQELAGSTPADWIIAERDGEVIGYGQTLWNWAERDGTHVFLHMGWVVPAARGQGVGSELLARLEVRCREKAARTPAIRYEYGANASGLEKSACAHLTTNGYFAAWTLWEMERRAAPLSSSTIPDGYELRAVLPEHHGAIWQCIGDAQPSDPSGRFQTVPGKDGLAAFFASDTDVRLVAWLGSRVAGQVLCRLKPWGAEIYEVSVAVAHRRRGLARYLITEALRALEARGVETVRLYTVQDNPTRAWQLYESLGFRRVGTFTRWRKEMTLP